MTLASDEFHLLRIAEVRRECGEAVSLVLDVPDALRPTFAYRAGQYLTFRFTIDGKQLTRSYSMSSAPEIDPALRVTIKRVEGGRVSNWIADTLQPGDSVEAMAPAGHFCLQPRDNPIVLLGGGSGITPLFSLAKSALAATERQVALIYANRDRASVIFPEELEALAMAYRDRFALTHWLDDERGLFSGESLPSLTGADVYICGPDAFMEVAEKAARAAGAENGHIFIERFVSPLDADELPLTAADFMKQGRVCETILARLRRDEAEGPYRDGDTLLEAARRIGLRPPSSCHAGACATCIAKLIEGSAKMWVNDVLTEQEVADGYILTCQAVPTSTKVVFRYED